MPAGRVKWFDSKKGYGFIKDNNSEKDIFLHISSLEKSKLRVLKENPEIPMSATTQQIVDTAMKRGDVIKARTTQKKHIETKKLLNMRK